MYTVFSTQHLSYENQDGNVYLNSTALRRTAGLAISTAILIVALTNPAVIPFGTLGLVLADATAALLLIAALMPEQENGDAPITANIKRATEGQLNITDKVLLTLLAVSGTAITVALFAPAYLPLALAGLAAFSLWVKATIGTLSAGAAIYGTALLVKNGLFTSESSKLESSKEKVQIIQTTPGVRQSA